MSTHRNHLAGSDLRTAEKILSAAFHQWTQAPGPVQENAIRAFVTVSRQPGAGGNSFSHRLAARLNESGKADWSAWDRELIEKVSAEHGIAKELIEALPTRHHNWLDDMLQGLFSSQTPPDIAEIRAYKKVMMTIRVLAGAGHAIIVGQGGSFITQGMPGAIHLRLIAPVEHRLHHIIERDQISLVEAARRIKEMDEHRDEFYHRYWPGQCRGPEAFTMTLNVAELSIDEMIESVLPVIQSREAGRNAIAPIAGSARAEVVTSK